VSRALTKYSYGTSKATSSKLQILMETPWKIFEQAKEQKNHDRDLESYGALLADVHKGISTGKIKLKDSDKTIKHFEMIIDSLPDLKRRSELLSHRLRSLEKKKDHSIISTAEDLRRKLKDNKVALDNNRLYLERLENEIKEKKISIKDTARECEDCLSSVTGRSYVLEIGIEQ
jgi:chromosome segregation ATPase